MAYKRQPGGKLKRSKKPVVKIESDGEDIFVTLDGLKIAKRGHPATPQAKTWVSLEPGWSVTGLETIEIHYEGSKVH